MEWSQTSPCWELLFNLESYIDILYLWRLNSQLLVRHHRGGRWSLAISLFESQHFIFFPNRWIVKKEHVYFGASLKKSKHHSNINFVNSVNFYFFIWKEAISIRNHLKAISKVNWTLFKWRGEGVFQSNELFWLLSPCLILFKALGVGQVKDVKQRWYLITIRNVFAII